MSVIWKLIIVINIFPHHVLLFNRVDNDYDLYGIKIATNDLVMVAADNVFAGWWYMVDVTISNPTLCFVPYNCTTCDFGYSVVVPFIDSTLFVYNCIDMNGNTIIGILNTSYQCNIELINEKMITGYTPQDNYIIEVDGDGTGVYGFADDFILFYSLRPPFQLTVWPNTFNISPRAINIGSSMTYAAVVGYCQVALSLAVECGSIFALNQSLSLPNRVTDIDINSYLNFSWSDPRINHRVTQSRVYSTNTIMSVNIAWQARQILIGIPSVNMVLLYAFDTEVQLISIRQNGIGFSGFGKSVAWLDEQGHKAVIFDARSLYQNGQWVSSLIHFYDIESDGFNDEAQPIHIYPNSEQILLGTMNNVLLRIIASKSGHIAIFDNLGNAGIMLKAPEGMYSNTRSHNLASVAVPCILGTSRNYSSIELCVPCPAGTFSSSCEPCEGNESFCPQGSVDDLPYSTLESIEQEQEYPESPEVTVFDDLLMNSMFSVHTKSSFCIVVSPMTWVLAVLTLGILIASAVVLSEAHFPHRQAGCHRFRQLLQKMDLIGEGEFWIGGLFSVSIMVLLISAYAFANTFLNRYPIESVPIDHSLACGIATYNAKFSTSMQKLPGSHRSKKHNQPIFDLLNAQPFELRIDLIQSAFTCEDSILIYHVIDYTLLPLPISTCTENYNGSILSLGISLSSHDITIQITLPGVRTVGAVRLGLFGPPATIEDGRYTLEELNFASTFVSSSLNQVLAPSTVFGIQLTPVVNQTAPLSADGVQTFRGIWTSSFDVKTSELFVTETRYTFFRRAETNISVVIQGTVFYVSNIEEPIARQTEIIFRTLLFTVVVLELFGLAFLIKKLLIIPLYRIVISHGKQYWSRRKGNTVSVVHNTPSVQMNETDGSILNKHGDRVEVFDQNQETIHTIVRFNRM